MEYTVFAPAVGISVMTASLITHRTPEEIAAQMGLSFDLLFDPHHRFSHHVLTKCWEELSACHEDFGFVAAHLVGTKSQTLVEYVASNAPTVKDGFQILMRYQRLIHDAACHSLNELSDRIVLRLEVKASARLPHALCDFLSGTFFLKTNGRIREPLKPLAVKLPRRTPSESALETFGIEPMLGSEHPEIHWPKQLFSSLLATSSDESLFFLLSRKLDEAIGALSPKQAVVSAPAIIESDLLGALRRELRPALARGDTTIEYLAEKLHVSPRTLQRTLQEKGTSFRNVVEEVRKTIATYLLLQENTTVLDAALSTGFSQTSAFTRAFKRWTGVSPAEYVKQHTTE